MALEREYRELTFVGRWSTLRRLRTESVAEHSYYVTLYADQVAGLIQWHGDYARLMRAALLHDLPEAASGDPPGPAKRSMYDRIRLRFFQMRYVQTRFPDALTAWAVLEADAEVATIIKVADLLDEIFYLQTERGLGNLNVGALDDISNPLGNSIYRLRHTWDQLPGQGLLTVWQNVVWPAIVHAGPTRTSAIVVDATSHELSLPREAAD